MSRSHSHAASILGHALVVLILALLLAPRAEAGRTTYVDKNHGFSIDLPQRDDWSQTPTQPGEKTEVAKFKDDRKREFATLSIYRFASTEDETTTPRPGQASPRMPPGFETPKNAKAYLENALRWPLMQFGIETVVLPDAKTIEIDDTEGQLFVIELEHPRSRGLKRTYAAAIAEKGAEEYLLIFQTHKSYKKVRPHFEKSLKSFLFVAKKESKIKDVEKRGKEIKGKGEELIDPEKRARIKKALDGVGKWRYIDTPHYIVIYNCDRGLADTIAKRIEYMREYAFQTVFPPLEPIKECMVVRICKEMDEYHHYGGPRGSAGYWASGRDEFVLPDLSSSKKADSKTIGVLHHEGFHQYIYYALLKNNPPVWFNEGYAEYFYCVNSTRKKLSFDKRHEMRHSVVKSALGSGQLIPVKDFVKLTHRQYMQRANLCYAQGWAFATWLKNITKNERYRQIPQIYFDELQRGYLEASSQGGMMGGYARRNEITEKALEKAFEGIDWDEIDADFQKDLKKRM